MMSEAKVLQALIDLFLRRVSEAERELVAALGGGSGAGYWRLAGVPQRGKIGFNRYCFHGRGCRFTFSDVTVDYDYGAGNTSDEFDLWRLQIFGKQVDEYADYVASDSFRRDFDNARRQGHIEVTEFGYRRASKWFSS